jgi:hypothetical protein
MNFPARPLAPSALGWLLALIGLIITIVLIVVGHLAVLPLGLLFILAFLALLL